MADAVEVTSRRKGLVMGDNVTLRASRSAAQLMHVIKCIIHVIHCARNELVERCIVMATETKIILQLLRILMSRHYITTFK